MNIIFRVDASNQIGTGHIMRCLTLANLLKEKDAKVAFICAKTAGNFIDYISKKGYPVYPIPSFDDFLQDAKGTIEILKRIEVNLLIVDHYQIDANWEMAVKESMGGIPIMVIDDLANRNHKCDLLLDQNYLKDFKHRYDGLVPEHCRKLLGPKYLLLRPEFYENKLIRREGSRKNLLVFYGGSDPTNETVKALEALEHFPITDLDVYVVVGLSNQQKNFIERKCKQNGFQFYVQIDFLADLMREADFSLGAGGVTMWERCFLGLPSIVTIVAENQIESTKAAAEFGAVWNLGWHEGVKVSHLVDIIKRAINHPMELESMSNRAKQLMQSGTTYKIHPVVEAITEVIKSGKRSDKY